MEKMIGHPCNDCETGKYVKNPKTGKIFCDKKCWLNGTNASPQAEKPAERNSDPLQEDLQRRVAELELYRANMKPYLEKLVSEFKSLRILVEEVAGKKATDLHVALPNRDIHETKTPSLEEAAKIVDSHKEIPIINELPKGFETLQRSM